MKFPALPTAVFAFAIAVTAAPTTDTHLSPRAGTDWTMRAYNLATPSCKNAFWLFEGSDTQGCTNMTNPVTAVNIETDVDCVITVYAEPGCPQGAGKALGPGAHGCFPGAVESFKVDCGAV